MEDMNDTYNLNENKKRAEQFETAATAPDDLQRSLFSDLWKELNNNNNTIDESHNPEAVQRLTNELAAELGDEMQCPISPCIPVENTECDHDHQLQFMQCPSPPITMEFINCGSPNSPCIPVEEQRPRAVPTVTDLDHHQLQSMQRPSPVPIPMKFMNRDSPNSPTALHSNAAANTMVETTITNSLSDRQSTSYSSAVNFQERPGAEAGTGRNNYGRRPNLPDGRWTEDEHMLFLMGLEKYKNGNWKDIATEFVVTRTSTQVASHAQKHFNHHRNKSNSEQPNPNSSKSSIFNITTVDPQYSRTRLLRRLRRHHAPAAIQPPGRRFHDLPLPTILQYLTDKTRLSTITHPVSI